MKIIHIEKITDKELFHRVHDVKLRGHGQPKVYSGCGLNLGVYFPDELRPTQRYVLNHIIKTVYDVVDALIPFDIDGFRLNGGVWFWPEGSNPATDSGIPFLPPIIETSVEPAPLGRVWLINDGMHRVAAAKKRGIPINCVHVHGKPKHPYYAYALPGGWDDVDQLDELPADYPKKTYREPDDHKALFRDFNAQFPGVQKDRPRVTTSAT